jgi:general secretion pathway protein A
MYKQFFGLRANPFNVNPDPRYLFLTRHTEEALACLTYGIQSRKGFVLLTGEVGTGKTTLINKLFEWLRLQQVATAFVFNSRLNVPQFLDYMMADFGIPCDSRSKSQILLRLYNWLLDRYRAGETAVLIIDEAQNLSDELLEEIRLMTNLETSTEKLLQIVLVGQPELEAASLAAVAAEAHTASEDPCFDHGRNQGLRGAAIANCWVLWRSGV